MNKNNKKLCKFRFPINLKNGMSNYDFYKINKKINKENQISKFSKIGNYDDNFNEVCTGINNPIFDIMSNNFDILWNISILLTDIDKFQNKIFEYYPKTIKDNRDFMRHTANLLSILTYSVFIYHNSKDERIRNLFSKSFYEINISEKEFIEALIYDLNNSVNCFPLDIPNYKYQEIQKRAEELYKKVDFTNISDEKIPLKTYLNNYNASYSTLRMDNALLKINKIYPSFGYYLSFIDNNEYIKNGELHIKIYSVNKFISLLVEFIIETILECLDIKINIVFEYVDIFDEEEIKKNPISSSFDLRDITFETKDVYFLYNYYAINKYKLCSFYDFENAIKFLHSQFSKNPSPYIQQYFDSVYMRGNSIYEKDNSEVNDKIYDICFKRKRIYHIYIVNLNKNFTIDKRKLFKKINKNLKSYIPSDGIRKIRYRIKVYDISKTENNDLGIMSNMIFTENQFFNDFFMRKRNCEQYFTHFVCSSQYLK